MKEVKKVVIARWNGRVSHIQQILPRVKQIFLF